MTTDQKQAIRILNNLNERCGEELFGDEEYFLLLEFVIGGGRIEPANTPWNVPWDERKLPDITITTVYGCPVDDTIIYKQNCNKKEEQE